MRKRFSLAHLKFTEKFCHSSFIASLANKKKSQRHSVILADLSATSASIFVLIRLASLIKGLFLLCI